MAARKNILIILIVLMGILAAIPVNATNSNPVPGVSSPLDEPDVEFYTDQNGKHLSFYSVFYDTQPTSRYLYKLYVYEATFPVDSEPVFYIGMKNWFVININCDKSFQYTITDINVQDGTVGYSSSNTATTMSSASYGFVDPAHLYHSKITFPANANNYDIYGYYSMPSNLTRVYYQDNQNLLPFSWEVSPFVSWNAVVPYVHSYSSYLSEPIYDPYNRYFVLAGEENQYLFLVSFSLSEYTIIESQQVDQSAFQTILYNLFTPQLILDSNQLKLQVSIDQNTLQILSNNYSDHLYNYKVMVAKYNLLDGQYISSSLYNGLVTTSVTPMSFDFGAVNSYDSIKTYGIQYIDNSSSSLHYNFLRCSWGHDPDFESWRDNVLYYLQSIYDLLNQEAEETVTIADDTSALNEMESAKNDLVITNENGEAVDAAEAASQNFSMAAEQIGELAEPVGVINQLMQEVIFSKPKLVLPIIVALALGLLVTILGKNKSD